ncbi:hypothetical protein [Bradyrhizobium sp. ORS 86]|uniref:hypothetical protein n=1 Tax=Bradyrhizobium sp. ORS 86 TaxID=1685970 RepID=UPI00388FBAF9
MSVSSWQRLAAAIRRERDNLVKAARGTDRGRTVGSRLRDISYQCRHREGAERCDNRVGKT